MYLVFHLLFPRFIKRGGASKCPNNEFNVALRWILQLGAICKREKKDFPYIIPLIQINDAADTSDGENKRLQIEALLGDFDYIGYREEIFSSNDDANDFAGYIRETLEGVLLADGKAPTKLILILDVGYLFPNKHVQAADKVVKILNAISDLCIQHVIVTGTSFPLALSDFVEDQKAVEYEGTLNSETVPMYQCINSNYFGGVMPLYGDYALIHPVKNTAETYARGWIPRIDVSCGDIMHFIRRRRKIGIIKQLIKMLPIELFQKMVLRYTGVLGKR